MNTNAHRPSSRAISLLAVLAMAMTFLVTGPTTADAHDTECVPEPSTVPSLADVMGLSNVFSTFTETDSVECMSKEDGVDAIMDRDWGDSNRPQSFAPCIRGMAADFFPCDGIDLMSHVSMAELGLGQGDIPAGVNDIWGWTDYGVRGQARDYALLGADEGTVFIDITDAKRPVVLGILPASSTDGPDGWRDIKVYQDHAFVVSEQDDHGVQVFDLTRLRDWDGSYTVYDQDALYTGIGSAHNIAINEDTGFAYVVGSSPFGRPNLIQVAGVDFGAGQAVFGGILDETGFTAPIVDVSPSLACNGDPITADVTGAVALIDRGACRFDEKATNAQAAGAVGVIIANNQDTGAITLGGDATLPITIPVVSVSLEDGAAIRALLPADALIAAEPEPLCGTGLHMVDISSPQNPTYAGCMDETGYVHDTQCVVYEGPDADHRGREICFNSNGYAVSSNPEANWFSITDVTDKDNPQVLSYIGYEGSGYSHQGWLTPDQEYFLFGDEGDESLFGVGTTTRTWDVRDLDNPAVIGVFENTTASIDHNLYTQGDYAYASNYSSGLRVYDYSDPANLEEVAWFDIYPENDIASFAGGSWSNYPYFHQKGIVAVSSVERGLFILRPRLARSGN